VVSHVKLTEEQYQKYKDMPVINMYATPLSNILPDTKISDTEHWDPGQGEVTCKPPHSVVIVLSLTTAQAFRLRRIVSSKFASMMQHQNPRYVTPGLLTQPVPIHPT
jgi:hypothetical protein